MVIINYYLIISVGQEFTQGPGVVAGLCSTSRSSAGRLRSGELKPSQCVTEAAGCSPSGSLSALASRRCKLIPFHRDLTTRWLIDGPQNNVAGFSQSKRKSPVEACTSWPTLGSRRAWFPLFCWAQGEPLVPAHIQGQRIWFHLCKEIVSKNWEHVLKLSQGNWANS